MQTQLNQFARHFGLAQNGVGYLLSLLYHQLALKVGYRLVYRLADKKAEVAVTSVL